MSDFFSMGGFGVFIWGAMGIALLLMLIEVFSLVLKRRTLIRQIKRNNRLDTRQKRDSR